MLYFNMYILNISVDTIASVQDYDGGVIPISEVLKFFAKFHDILDKAMFNRLAIQLIF